MEKYAQEDPIPSIIIKSARYLVEPDAFYEPNKQRIEVMAIKAGVVAYFEYDPSAATGSITDSEFYAFTNLRKALEFKRELLQDNPKRLVYGIKVQPNTLENSEFSFKQTPLTPLEKFLISSFDPKATIGEGIF